MQCQKRHGSGVAGPKGMHMGPAADCRAGRPPGPRAEQRTAVASGRQEDEKEADAIRIARARK
ncbi:hypothetical protein Sgleb_49170 [Streptomyces glebosus]|uniref:Uncharacterized protein n=1 Tax=Streptomyces glebosus TaxID=249580 RepID=A0A640T148_9ACTN|nr:hypothetical protein Sgleb_49170 [Streptomyces glebosus]GHG86498.1 hypothetical protein GCM10010513_67840 [Streptomyces glebosus]